MYTKSVLSLCCSMSCQTRRVCSILLFLSLLSSPDTFTCVFLPSHPFLLCLCWLCPFPLQLLLKRHPWIHLALLLIPIACRYTCLCLDGMVSRRCTTLFPLSFYLLRIGSSCLRLSCISFGNCLPREILVPFSLEAVLRTSSRCGYLLNFATIGRGLWSCFRPSL